MILSKIGRGNEMSMRQLDQNKTGKGRVGHRTQEKHVPKIKGKMGGGKSRFKDSLQQSKTIILGYP